MAMEVVAGRSSNGTHTHPCGGRRPSPQMPCDVTCQIDDMRLELLPRRRHLHDTQLYRLGWKHKATLGPPLVGKHGGIPTVCC